MDHDFVGRRGIEDQIGIRVRDDSTKTACVCELAGMRMQSDEVDYRLDSRFDVMCALWGAFIDI
jgi:hypothetical protein